LATKKILIVDDEADITFTLKEGIEKSGSFSVDAFNDPQLALTNYKSGYYDLLIIDIRMPRMTGFELYRKIREIDSKVTVCFITAYETYYEKFRQEFFPLEEIKGFIRKPIQVEDLERFVKAVTR
jgi:two-component system, OmpR family, response regulator ChvI